MDDKRKTTLVKEDEMPNFNEIGDLIKFPTGLSDFDRETFDFLGACFLTNAVVLLQCRNKKTRDLVPVICATRQLPDGTVEMAPLAALFTSDPFELYEPADEGFARA